MSEVARPTLMIDVGQTIGNYRITSKIGEGGMGVVYLAEHPLIGKKVAMKAIHPELSRNPEVVSRFEMEAKAVNQIGHEHIVDIIDFGNTRDGEFYFIMEYLQGESLAERLKREKLIPQKRALTIASQVADALGASHRHRIIHRDLKPENIFLVNRGPGRDFVKVLDFGLAKLTQLEEKSKVNHKTRTGSVMGTPYYMSPEQCEGKLAIDHRADIYALGIMLFEMLTGKVPFGGEGYGEIIVKHVTHQLPSVRSINPDVSPAVELILYRALTKDRDERFQTMEDFRQALLDPEAYASSAPVIGLPDDVSGVARLAAPMARDEMVLTLRTPPPPSAITPGPTPLPVGANQPSGAVMLAPRSSRKVVMTIMGAVAVAGIGIVFFSGSKAQSPRAASVAAPVPAPKVTTVRVNFNSDPGGASVVRVDTGQELGQTPLSTEVPYSDTAVQFLLRRAGYEDKVVHIVPNLPAPLFVTLRPVPPPTDPAADQGVGAGRRNSMRPSGRRQAERVERKSDIVDEDAVLAPSF